jgi:hypothetical protein
VYLTNEPVPDEMWDQPALDTGQSTINGWRAQQFIQFCLITSESQVGPQGIGDSSALMEAGNVVGGRVRWETERGMGELDC